MTSLNKEKIFKKLSKLEEYLEYLNQLRSEVKSEEDFVNDFHLFGNTEHYLQLSIQAILDISHLISSALDLERADNNYAVIDILNRNNIIDDDLREKLSKMIGMRNILVHGYEEIDRSRVYSVLQNNIEDIKSFQEAISSFLSN